MRMVSQAKLNIKGGGPNGQQRFITHSLEMPVPYSFYPKVSEEGTVWKNKRRCKRNNLWDILKEKVH